MPDMNKGYTVPTLTRDGDVAVTVRLSFSITGSGPTTTKRVVCKVNQVEDAMFYYRQTCGYKLTYVEYLADEIYYLATPRSPADQNGPESGAVCEYYFDLDTGVEFKSDERLRELEPFGDANPESRNE
tara:strand:- start:8630 stop:9013 length:384 start_codon:yes stop_codon:yes gene_type:complete